MGGFGALTPTERVSSLLVVSLPEDGLVPGFEADAWIIVERFQEEGEAKFRLHRILAMLDKFKARAFIVRETAPRERNKMVSWRTIVRYKEPDLYLDPVDAYDASPEALRNWEAAVDLFLSPPRPVAKRPPAQRKSLALPASIAAAIVATVGIVVAVQAPGNGPAIDPSNEFARQGGFMMTVPDKGRPGYYVRLKVHPNKFVEVVDWFAGADPRARNAFRDVTAEDGADALMERAVRSKGGEPGSMRPKLQAISSSSKRD